MPTEYYDITPMCVDLNSHTTNICFTKKDCNPTSDLILKDCDNLHNCNLCAGDSLYTIPYKQGKQITLQTSFLDSYNADPENPTSGWGDFIEVEVLDSAGAVYSSDVNAFTSDYLVGYKEASFQLITIDTSKVPDCFSLRFKVKDSTGNTVKEVCSEPFQKLPTLCNNQVVSIRSEHSTTDCENNEYRLADGYTGTSNYKFDNEVCIYANLVKEAGNIERTNENGENINVTHNEIYTLQLTCPIPCYMHDYLMKVIFTGQNIFIDGEEYQVDSVAPENLHRGSMFMYSVTVYRVCEIVGGC